MRLPKGVRNCLMDADRCWMYGRVTDILGGSCSFSELIYSCNLNDSGSVSIFKI